MEIDSFGLNKVAEQLRDWADNFIMSLFGDPYDKLRKMAAIIMNLENKTPKEYGRYLAEKKCRKIHFCKTYKVDRKRQKYLPYQRRNY